MTETENHMQEVYAAQTPLPADEPRPATPDELEVLRQKLTGVEPTYAQKIVFTQKPRNPEFEEMRLRPDEPPSHLEPEFEELRKAMQWPVDQRDVIREMNRVRTAMDSALAYVPRETNRIYAMQYRRHDCAVAEWLARWAYHYDRGSMVEPYNGFSVGPAGDLYLVIEWKEYRVLEGDFVVCHRVLGDETATKLGLMGNDDFLALYKRDLSDD